MLDDWGNDFKIYWGVAERFMAGDTIYSYNAGNKPDFLYPNFLYSPISLLLFLPFCKLSYYEASLIWFLLIHLFIIASVWMIYRIGSRQSKIDSLAASMTAFCLSMPLYFNIFIANINIFILFCICCAYWLLYSSHKSIIPLLLSICTYIKIYPAFLMAPFIRSRDYKTSIIFISSIIIIGMASLFIFGVDEHINYINSLRKGFIYYEIMHASSLSYLMRLLFPELSTITINIFNLFFAVLLCSLWLMKAGIVVNKGKNTSAMVVDLFLLTVMALLLFPGSWLFYNELLAVPFYFILFSWFRHGNVFRFLTVFVVIFILTNLWEIIFTHVPITMDHLTARDILANKNHSVILYKLTSSLPFILNLSFFLWVLVNYNNLKKQLENLIYR